MLGVLGGGQLGLMFSLSAKRMGFKTTVVDPDPDAPAFSIADRKIIGSYSDPELLADLTASCHAVTTEFENVPADSLAVLEQALTVRPSSHSVATCQDRILEKSFLRDNGFPTAPFLTLPGESSPADFKLHPLLPGILKASREGYDGKGQWSVSSYEELSRILINTTGPFVLEKRLDLQAEYSIVLARSHDGEMAFYPVAENIHESGILHISAVPADIPLELSELIKKTAANIANRLDYVGVLSVEFFLGKEGGLYVNELAPRPHNSGHYTIDACQSSQFDQHVRVLTGIPLARTDLLSPCAMGNLLGHLWTDQSPPDLQGILEHPSAKLYLYGKKHARPGRKMGHFTVFGTHVTEAKLHARNLLSRLSGNPMNHESPDFQFTASRKNNLSPPAEKT